MDFSRERQKRIQRVSTDTLNFSRYLRERMRRRKNSGWKVGLLEHIPAGAYHLMGS